MGSPSVWHCRLNLLEPRLEIALSLGNRLRCSPGLLGSVLGCIPNWCLGCHVGLNLVPMSVSTRVMNFNVRFINDCIPIVIVHHRLLHWLLVVWLGVNNNVLCCWMSLRRTNQDIIEVHISVMVPINAI